MRRDDGIPMAGIHITDIESAINWWRERAPSPDGVTACREVRDLAEVYALLVYYHESECDEDSMPAGAKTASPEHGTAVAAILVGQRSGGGSGLLPGAELAVADVFGADPDGIPIGDVMALVGGLDWLLSSRVPVINMSFAGDANAVVALALRRVIADHVIVVAAAGNGGPAAAPAFPSDEPGVIGVTAVDNHSQPYAEANRGDSIDFAAPGVRIWTPGPTAAGSYHTGTSFAAPFVTAAVAARLANGAAADADRIVDWLGKTAIDLGQPGKDPVFGRGLIQFANPCSQQTQ